MTGKIYYRPLQYLPQCHDIERIIHHRRAEYPEIACVSTQFDFFHDHRTGVKLWEYVFFSDKSRNSTRDIQGLEIVDELVLVLQTLDHLIHLLTERSMMPLEIIREAEIIGCPE